MALQDSIATELHESSISHEDVPELVSHMTTLLQRLLDNYNDNEDYDHLALHILEAAVILAKPADVEIHHPETPSEVAPESHDEKHQFIASTASEKLPNFANYKGFLTQEELESINVPTYEFITEARDSIPETESGEVVKVNWGTGEYSVVMRVED